MQSFDGISFMWIGQFRTFEVVERESNYLNLPKMFVCVISLGLYQDKNVVDIKFRN